MPAASAAGLFIPHFTFYFSEFDLLGRRWPPPEFQRSENEIYVGGTPIIVHNIQACWRTNRSKCHLDFTYAWLHVECPLWEL